MKNKYFVFLIAFILTFFNLSSVKAVETFGIITSPLNAIVESISKDSIQLAWEKPLANYEDFLRYEIRYSDDSGSTWKPDVRNPGLNLNYEFQGLNRSSSYLFQVRAVGSDGNSNWVTFHEPDISVPISFSQGGTVTCVLLDNAKIECWGNNSYGGIGIGLVDSKSYKSRTKVPSLSEVTSLSSGATHTCVIVSNGKVFCWGKNNYGQAGNGVSNPVSVPTEVKGVENAIQVSSGFNHTCALLKDQQIMCWGDNSTGQVFPGLVDYLDNSPVVIPNVQNATQVSAQGYHTCALLETKEIMCWGKDSSGILGDGEWISGSQGPSLVVGIDDAIFLAGNPYRNCTILIDKSVKCWGAKFGSPIYVPETIEGLGNVTSLNISHTLVCAAVLDSNVNCFGSGNYTGAQQVTDSFSPIEIPNTGNVTQIFGGTSRNCGLRIDNTIVCWGYISSSNYWLLDIEESFTVQEFSLPPLPATPVNLQISEISPQSISISWSTSELISSYPIDNFKIEFSDDGVNWESLETSETTVTLSNLENGVTVQIKVSAHNAIGWGAATEIIYGTTPELPEPPYDYSFSKVGRNQTSISWSAENVSEEYEIDSYRIEWSKDLITWESQISTVQNSEIQGLEPGLIYYFRIYAHSEVGWSLPGTVVNIKTLPPPGVPVSPANLTLTSITENSINVSWENSPQEDGLAIDKQKIEWSLDGENWSNKETNNLVFTIVNASKASRYFVRAYSHALAGWSMPSETLEVFTKGTREMEFTFEDSLGNPIIGGSVSWRLEDGSFSSAKNYGIPLSGKLIFPRVAAGNGSVSIFDAVLKDGSTVSGSWDVSLGGSSNALSLPQTPKIQQTQIKVILPNELPVTNAFVTVSGLSSTQTFSGFTFKTSAVTTGFTNSIGEVQTHGYQTGPLSAITTYNDGVLIQTKTSDILSDLATIRLEEMPWLTIDNTNKTANLNSLVSISVKAQEVAPKNAQFAMGFEQLSLIGSSVKIIPPKGSVQNCKGKVLKAKFNALGRALLKVCASKSGEYKIFGIGAVATSSLTLKVKGGAPTTVTEIRGVSEELGQAKISWSAPLYSGGAPIKNYKVELKGGGKKLRKTVKTKSATFTGLENATSYTATIWAVTKNGKSDPVTVKVDVA